MDLLFFATVTRYRGWMGRDYVLGTIRDFFPKVCEELQQIFSKYRESLEKICCKPKQTEKISRAKYIIPAHPSRDSEDRSRK